MIVIPGHREAMSPESITTIGSMDSGPAPSGASRNDEAAVQRTFISMQRNSPSSTHEAEH
jgi:hypothetical protein